MDDLCRQSKIRYSKTKYRCVRYFQDRRNMLVRPQWKRERLLHSTRFFPVVFLTRRLEYNDFAPTGFFRVRYLPDEDKMTTEWKGWERERLLHSSPFFSSEFFTSWVEYDDFAPAGSFRVLCLPGITTIRRQEERNENAIDCYTPPDFFRVHFSLDE